MLFCSVLVLSLFPDVHSSAEEKKIFKNKMKKSWFLIQLIGQMKVREFL